MSSTLAKVPQSVLSIIPEKLGGKWMIRYLFRLQDVTHNYGTSIYFCADCTIRMQPPAKSFNAVYLFQC